MAGTLLHVTLTNLALSRASLPRSARTVLWAHLDDFHLGAVLFDLPYYEHLLFQGLWRAIGRDYHYSAWGTDLHLRSPVGLCLRLLERAATPAGKATAVGAMTHAAVDMVFHPEIERRVRSTEAGRAGPNRAHHHIETQMDIFLHRRIIGGTGIGSPYAAQALNLRPDADWVPRFREAVAFVHGKAPSSRRVRSWLRGIHRFRLLHCRPEPFWVSTFYEPDKERDETANRLLEDSLAYAAHLIALGWTAAEDPSATAAILEALPDIDLVCGKPALPNLRTTVRI